MPNQTETPAEPIRFRTNVIAPDPSAPGGSRFVVAGQPSPFFDIGEVPINLRPVIATADDEPQEENTPRGNFQLNTPYELTPDNRLGRAHGRSVERQVAAFQAENQLHEELEKEVNSELPEEIARDLQASHQDSVALQAAEMRAAASHADQITDSIIAEQQPKQMYVRRGSRHYVQIDRTRLKPAEPVFTKDDTGAYEAIGICDANAQPPDVPITL